MNCKFSLTHNNLVAETEWSGDLTHDIMVAGIVQQNQWIIAHSDKLPLVLVSDYTKANLESVTAADLQSIADQFHGAADLFPDMAWIAIMPRDITYDMVRLWLEHAESLYDDSYVVNDRSKVKNIVSDLLTRYQ